MPDTITVKDDLTVHVVSEDGTREFFLPSYDPATQVYFADAEEAKSIAMKMAANPNAWMPFMSTEDRAAQVLALNSSDQRIKRNQLLADSDWTQMNDSPLSNEAKTSWATYRQSLRDITADESWPDVTFPDTP
jgi:hypothetical protein